MQPETQTQRPSIRFSTGPQITLTLTLISPRLSSSNNTCKELLNAPVEMPINVACAASNNSNYYLSESCRLQRRPVSTSTTIQLNQFHNPDLCWDNNFNSEAAKLCQHWRSLTGPKCLSSLPPSSSSSSSLYGQHQCRGADKSIQQINSATHERAHCY